MAKRLQKYTTLAYHSLRSRAASRSSSAVLTPFGALGPPGWRGPSLSRHRKRQMGRGMRDVPLPSRVRVWGPSYAPQRGLGQSPGQNNFCTFSAWTNTRGGNKLFGVLHGACPLPPFVAS